jgi:glycosyltransferase involved in cell wall biosynthesis
MGDHIESFSVCILSLSQIADDPRVRRQGDLFESCGWRVTAIGAPGVTKSDPPRWPILDPSSCEWQNVEVWNSECSGFGIGTRARRFVDAAVAGRIGGRVAPLRRVWNLPGTRYLLTRMDPTVASEIYWSWANIRQFYSCGLQTDARIFIANDWITLPLAARLAHAKGGIYFYDTHELATDEYAERREWRIMKRPFIRAIEATFLPGTAVISTVSRGIASRLSRLYPAAPDPIVIRNVPAYQPTAFRPTGPTIRVLYHGILNENRGLEATIDSVVHWRPEFHLTIRGPGSEAYISELTSRIAERGLANRVTLAPPVAAMDLVREAVAFDIGLFALPAPTRHYRYALPNKFFEYVMAGLALCVTNLPDMTFLVREYDLGNLIGAVTPRAIADAVNRFDAAGVDRFKQNCLQAANQLNWQAESKLLLAAYVSALRRDARAHQM